MKRDESTPYKKIFLKIEWGVTKILNLEKYSFGDEYFYAAGFEVEGSKSIGVMNPFYVYPVETRIDSNPAAQVLNQFYESSSLLPECSLWVRTMQMHVDILEYRFKTVKVLEKYGRSGSRFFTYYKLRFDNWFGR